MPRTADSRHGFAIVINLIRGLVPTGIDQIWVADITYVPLGEAFIYLAVVLVRSAARSSAGHSTIISKPGWQPMRSTWRSMHATPRWTA